MSNATLYRKYCYLICVVNILIAIVFFLYIWILFEPKITYKIISFKNFSDIEDCYKSYAFETYEEENYNNRLQDILQLEDAVFSKTDGNNIFFHQTDCIHDGIVRLGAR